MSKTLPVDMRGLREFVIESNAIESISRDEELLQREIEAHEAFIQLPRIEIRNVVRLVNTLQTDAQLRDHPDVPGVKVVAMVQRSSGAVEHVVMSDPPESGPLIRTFLQDILDDVHAMKDPYVTHVNYETLHPFTDGNGRSGRAIWLWQMLRTETPWGYRFEIPFLQKWYYDSMPAHRLDG